MNSRIGAQIDKENTKVTIWVNDVRVYRNDKPMWHSGGAFFNQWLKPGDNEFRYRIEAAEGAAGPPGGRLEFARQNFETNEVHKLHTLDSIESLPVEHTFTVDVPDAKGLAFWSEAAVVTLDDAAVKAIKKDVMSLHRLAAEKRGADFVDKLKSSMTAMFAAMGLADEPGALDEEVDGMRAVIESGAQLAPLNEDDIAVELMAGGRLIEAARRDGEPLVVLQLEDESEMTFDNLYYAQVGGNWVIVA